MIWILIWLLLGSLSVNIMWVSTHKNMMGMIREHVPGMLSYKAPTNKDYVRDMVSIVFGPLALPARKLLDYLYERDKRKRLNEAIKRKRGNARLVKNGKSN